MSEWKDVTIGDYIDLISGFAFKSSNFLDEQVENSLPVVKIKNVANGDTNLNDVVFHMYDNSLEKYLLKKDDVLIAMTGNHPQALSQVVGGVSKYKLDTHSLLNQRVGKIIAKENTCLDFVYYLFKDKDVQNYLANQSSGSANQANISKKDILELNLKIPSPTLQRTIAGILSSLDDKIDLLNRQNQTLESMAEALFRHYFIDNAQPDWKDGKLDKEFYFLMGQSPSGESFNEENIGIPMYQGNTDFGFRFPNNRVFTTEPKRFAEKFDTLISVRAPVGAQNMADEKCCIGRGVASFRYKEEKSFYSYTYYKMMSLMEEIKQFNESGTVFGSISKSDFENISIIIPDAESIICFQKNVKPIDDKIYNNQTQINTLSNLRNTLLPKLMNGEVYMEIT